MANFGCYFLVLFLSLHIVQSLTETYNFEDSCYYKINDLDDDDTYYVAWNGNSVSSSSCSMSFHTRDDDDFEEFKICIEVEDFDISSEDCSVYLEYQNGDSAGNTERYSCGSYPSKWCSGSGESVDIVLKNAEYSNAGLSNFRLMVTATKTYTYDDQTYLVYVAVGCGVGGIVLSALVAIVVVRCVIRRRRMASQYPQLQPNSSVPYDSINSTQNAYGVENPPKDFTHPPQYGACNSSPAASSTNARATPPPNYITTASTTVTTTTGVE